MSNAPLPHNTLPGSDADAFRQLARRWAATVNVVTVLRREGTHGLDAPALDGFTATAFLTVSMDPPIVLVSASNATSAAPMLRDADHLVVNLLAEDQQALAESFARAQEHRADLWTALPWTPDAAGAPVLGGTLGAFSARVRERLDAGDHTLVLGDVTAIHLGTAESPLVYFNRAYAAVSPREE